MNDFVSRRTFINTATAAAIASSAAMNSVGQANRRIRIGVAGTGVRGRELLYHLATIDNAEIVAVCDNYPTHLELGEQLAGAQADAFANYAAMLERAQLDAVVVATPPRFHHPMSIAAIDQGLAVYCETSMCPSIGEARALAAHVDQQNAIFQLGLQRRSNAIYEQAEAMVRTGMLGTITSIKCQWHVNESGRKPIPLSRDNPEYDRLDRKLNWRLYRDSGHGPMAEFGSHQMDVVNRLLAAAPTRVIAMGGVDHWQDGRETYDNVFCTYEYDVADTGEGKPQTVRVTFSSILTNAHEGVSELIMGTKGTLLLSSKMGLFYRERPDDTTSQQIDGRSGATTLIPDSPWEHRGKSTQISSSADDTRAALVSFVEAVRTGNRNTACNVRIGLENTATVLIANDAIESGGPIAFPEDCRTGGPSSALA